MKILKKAKKGFTIVELVIVIAVIAVLAAVLIPTFINLTAKANKAADESLVTSLNKALAIEEVDHDIDNMHDAVECLKKEGYLVSTLVTKSDQKLLYDLDKNRFLLEEDKDSDKDDYEYWTIADSYDATKQKYSIYATDTFSTEEVSGLKVGFDAGDCTTVKRIDYVGTGSAQKVIIRSYDGIVTVNAPTDVVKHYKYADALNIVAVAPSSYHEYGTVGFAQMASGHFVAEDGAQVVKMHIASNDADIKVEKKAIVDFWSKESTVTTAVVNENGQAKDIASIDNETIADFEEAASSYVESQVCKIGELRYASLQEAVNAAKEGEQIDLIKNLTQEAGILVDKNGVSFKLDLCGHTFKVTKGNNVSWRAVKVVGGTIAISNGEIDARNETSITSGTGNGAYGTVRIEPDTGKQAKAILTDLTLYNNHHFGLSVKACTNGFAELTRCAVYSDVGGVRHQYIRLPERAETDAAETVRPFVHVGALRSDLYCESAFGRNHTG